MLPTLIENINYHIKFDLSKPKRLLCFQIFDVMPGMENFCTEQITTLRSFRYLSLRYTSHRFSITSLSHRFTGLDHHPLSSPWCSKIPAVPHERVQFRVDVVLQCVERVVTIYFGHYFANVTCTVQFATSCFYFHWGREGGVASVLDFCLLDGYTVKSVIVS